MTITKKYKISVQTGLHIGTGQDTYEIGEMDSLVVKDFETGIPYIPGSSLKGKIRFLLEKKYAENREKKTLIENLFGVSAENKKESKMTIIIIRDAFVSMETEEKIKKLQEQGEPITEEKAEVKLKGGTTPRTIERVPKGYQFDLEVVFRFYEVKNKEEQKQYEALFEEGRKLLQEDYLGGSGTRGYGKISIEEVSS